eukprot:6698701-Heterocapsa_arctica.AAC.1
MRVAVDVATDQEVALASLDDDTKLRSKALWYLLVNAVKGRAPAGARSLDPSLTSGHAVPCLRLRRRRMAH